MVAFSTEAEKRGLAVTQKHQKAVWVAAIVIFVLFSAAVGWYIGVPMIRLAEDPQKFRDWVDASGVLGRILFIGMVVLQVLVAFIPGEPVELAAGYAFGVLEGSLLTMAGFLIGSWLVFRLVRRFGVQFVEVFFPSKQILEFAFLRNPKKTKIIAFILMMIPGTPKDFLSYFAGLTQLKEGEWLAIVAIARLPSLMTSTVTGGAAGVENYTLSAVMLAVTVLTSLVGILYYRELTRREQAAEEETKKDHS